MVELKVDKCAGLISRPTVKRVMRGEGSRPAQCGVSDIKVDNLGMQGGRTNSETGKRDEEQAGRT